MSFEYKVIPAPMQIKRAKGARTASERLAIEVQDAINEQAADGWVYLRSDTMTVMDKPGRFSRPVEVIETVLVFNRKSGDVEKAKASPLFATPEPKAEPKIEAPVARQPVEEKVVPAAPKLEENETPSLGGATRD